MDFKALLEELNETISSKEERLKAVKAELETREQFSEEEIAQREKEVESLTAERDAKLVEREKLIADHEKQLQLDAEKAKELAEREKNHMDKNEILKRDAEWLAKASEKGGRAICQRSILLSSNTIAQPTLANGVEGQNNIYPALVDLVFQKKAHGYASDAVSYDKTDCAATIGTEGTVAQTSEPAMGLVTMTPVIVSLTFDVGKYTLEGNATDVRDYIEAKALKAMKKKLSDLILAGDTQNNFFGITNAKDSANTAMAAAVSVTAIGADTLNKIVLQAIGGDDDTGGPAMLFLNKTNLAAFGAVRGTNEKKAIYTIVPDQLNPNMGTISDDKGVTVRYSLNNRIADTKMFYGKPGAYQLDEFSELSIGLSYEQKFNQGLVVVFADGRFGGNIIDKNAWAVITIGSN